MILFFKISAMVFLLLSAGMAFAGEMPPAESADKNHSRSLAAYNLPDVRLLDAEGRDRGFLETVDHGGPVLLQFIFATCSTICPLLSASFSAAQPALDQISAGNYRLISISIDPEEDRPEQLREYALRFKAGKNWQFFTGKPSDVRLLLNAFDAAYAANNKMSHKALTFMRPRPGADWIRIEGFLGKNMLIEEYKQMLSAGDR